MNPRSLNLPDGAVLLQDGPTWALLRDGEHVRYLSSFEAEFIGAAFAAGAAEANQAMEASRQEVDPSNPELVITLRQAKTLVEWFGGHDAEITVSKDGNSLVCWFTDYPGEGRLPLGKTEVQECITPVAAVRTVAPRR